MIGRTKNMLFSTFSQTCKWEGSKGFCGENLNHVITLRGQIWASRANDNPLSPPSRVHSKGLRVYVQKTSPCVPAPRRTCVSTCARGAGTHGDVLNLHTGVFSVPHTHHTHTPHTQAHTTTKHTTNTRTQRQRKTEKEDREREEKTRQDKMREEKMKERVRRQDKTRQDKTRQDKTRQDKTRQDKTRQDKTRQDKTRTRQDKTRQDKTRQDKTRQDKTRQDKTREMKEDIVENMSEKKKTPGELAHLMFRTKKPCGRFSTVFLRNVQNLTVVSTIYMIRIRFFGPRELIQRRFSVVGMHST